MSFVDETRRFALAVNQPEEHINLGQACFLIDAHVKHDLDVAAQMRRLDAIAVRCPAGFDGMRKYLFEDLGFHGNTERYDDPRNSFLSEVLDRRLGLPITLSILVMEVGKRTGVEVKGIGMPAHFVVRHGPQTFLDPFAGGEVLDAAGCRDRFHEIVGQEVPFDPDWLKPISTLSILMRVLANLKDVYTLRTQWQNVEWVLRARLSIPGCPPLERRELAAAIAEQGRFDEAARELELAAGTIPDAAARHDLLGEAVTMRARLN